MSEEIKNTNNNEDDDRKRGKIVLIIFAVILIIAGSVCLGYYLFEQYSARLNENDNTTVATTQEVSSEVKLAKNPIDFKKLRKQNTDIYAWLKVPGTKVDYPVVQHSSDDYFYLRHSAYDKSWKSSGAVYIELGNTKTFNDAVTMIYGHNGYGDTMFTTLHRFEDSEFFNKHSKFYIYMPHRKLTYRIISAFKYDDRHILNSFDFRDVDVFTDFLTMLQNPETNNKNVRKSLDKELTINDNIVILSTCFTNQRSNRYLVCGVLIKDEKTN